MPEILLHNTLMERFDIDFLERDHG